MRSVLIVEERTAARRKWNAAYDLENDATRVASGGVAGVHVGFLCRKDTREDARAERTRKGKREGK